MAFFLSSHLIFAELDKSQADLNDLMKNYKNEISRLKDQGALNSDSMKENLKKMISNKPLGNKFIKTFPKFIDFVVALMQDENALSKLLEMREDKKRLWNFFYIQIGLIVLSFLWRMSYRKKPFFSLEYITSAFTRTIAIWGLRLYAMIYFFGDELRPTYDLFVKTVL